MFHCKECLYFTERKPNLQRHISNKHKKEPTQTLISESEENIVPTEETQRIGKFNCQKCNKNYKTKKGLLGHESKCKESKMIPENNEGILSSNCVQCVQDNSNVFVVYCEDQIENKDKVIIIYNKSDNEKYKELFSKIIDIVKEAHIESPESIS